MTCYRLWLILWAGLLSFTANAAASNNDITWKTLTAHVQMLALLPEQTLLRQQLSMLNSAQSLGVVTQRALEEEIANFWQRQGVDIPYSALSPASSPLQRAIALEPQAAQYQAVVNRIQYLLWLQQQAWPILQPSGWLRPGDNHPLMPQITQRLLWLGDLSRYPENGYDYTEDIAEAVRHFQARHGLKVDAVIGPQTLRWLNVSPLQRASILARDFVAETVYRQKLSDSYILVNVPAYQLSLVESGQVVLQSKAIVGRPYRKTPLLQSVISSVVLNPGWHVPRSILRRDILPKIRQDGNYLQEREFTVVDYAGQQIEKSPEEWQQLAHERFPYRLIQQPGNLSALGRFKFHFLNSFDVYLHDTPDKQLFARHDRALSSGCVRVEKSFELAQWLIQHRVADVRKWDNMQDNFHTTQWFALKQPLPVYIVYWTSWIDGQGVAQFRDDVYKKFSTTDELR
ncbi:L,D-transpeptidase family protein [Shewanella sp. YIC-542]|uniref:L,D-transpeptidase family protein n=1 Tax=Shewanella mytili TaxID=3377111 RepID=UPI00398F058A